MLRLKVLQKFFNLRQRIFRLEQEPLKPAAALLQPSRTARFVGLLQPGEPIDCGLCFPSFPLRNRSAKAIRFIASKILEAKGHDI